MKKSTLTFLGIFQSLVAIAAIPAGISMLLAPDGSGVGMSTDILENAPFKNFLIPGLFLVFINGMGHAMGAILSFKASAQTGRWAMGLGLLLIGWISLQIYFIGLRHFLQPLFFGLGAMEFFLGLRYGLPKKQNS